MGELRCVDGSLLGVVAVPCRDRLGRLYDLTLELVRDSQPFAIVGQRCGHQLASLAAQVQAAREDPRQARSWPDPDDRFPVPGATAMFEPGDNEYFTLRSQGRADLPGNGEMRCVLRSTARWLSDTGITSGASRGHWQLRRRAVLEAWSDRGTGVRAVLTSAELVVFLDTVLKEPDRAVTAGPSPAVRAADERLGRRTARTMNWSAWRQRGRVPDGSARSCLPALRAAARGVALAVAGAQTRGSDVRR
ncbi:MAG TPA: hypothetical protein VN695_05200 [Streptosporangiaceae bacterium]|nr:hypothetical protein [Streptosporangiaceae bacterium]